jgi:hypothetical protein
MRRSGRLRRGKGLRRTGPLKRTTRFARRTPLSRAPFAPASAEQRRKIAGLRCVVCGAGGVDPAHLVARPLGGCDHPDCVVALCRVHHRLYDRGGLDLLPHLEPAWRAELAHALRHVGLLGLLRRVTGTRWTPEPATPNREQLEQRRNH